MADENQTTEGEAIEPTADEQRLLDALHDDEARGRLVDGDFGDLDGVELNDAARELITTAAGGDVEGFSIDYSIARNSNG